MVLLLHCQKLSKSYRARPLFTNLSIALEEGEKVGVLGPNGSGKSTLLRIAGGLEDADDGEITTKKDVRIVYLPQQDVFEEQTVGQVLEKAVEELHLEEHEARTRIEKQLTMCGFQNPDEPVSQLSGGWRKRLAIARALGKEPDLLLLDEPTNHLDLKGVLWLEQFLLDTRIPFVLVSHDRHFLENVTTRIVEINPAYEEGTLSVNGSYSDFLLERERYFSAQAHLEQALASKVRREVAWLQRGARARQTKSSARIKEAGNLIDSLAEVRARNAQNKSIDIDFNASGRKTKELLVAKGVEKSLGEKVVLANIDVTLRPGTRLAVVGANGSGKTTLLRLLAGQIQPDKGTIKRADGLRVVWFDQNRQQLDQNQTLWKALCPEGDSVTYRDRSTHVSTWARRFLFSTDQLHMPVSYLSGGEQARILIANLMLQPADLLILDEPTNDLDIPSLEVLEESLVEFPGAVILVTHDRFMIHEVANVILSLEGATKGTYFADYSQFEDALAESVEKARKEKLSAKPSIVQKEKPRSLSTSERKELTEIVGKIEKAEEAVTAIEAKMHDPMVASNHAELINLQAQLDEAHKKVRQLYERWEDLEQRQSLG